MQPKPVAKLLAIAGRTSGGNNAADGCSSAIGQRAAPYARPGPPPQRAATTCTGTSRALRNSASHSAAATPSATRCQSGLPVSQPSSSPCQTNCASWFFRFAARSPVGREQNKIHVAQYAAMPPGHQGRTGVAVAAGPNPAPSPSPLIASNWSSIGVSRRSARKFFPSRRPRNSSTALRAAITTMTVCTSPCRAAEHESSKQFASPAAATISPVAIPPSQPFRQTGLWAIQPPAGKQLPAAATPRSVWAAKKQFHDLATRLRRQRQITRQPRFAVQLKIPFGLKLPQSVRVEGRVENVADVPAGHN